MNADLFNQAKAAYGQHNFDVALKLYINCLQDRYYAPQPGEIGLIYHQMGNCLVKLNRVNDAIQAYTRANGDPSYDACGAVNYNLGMAYASARDYEKATKYFEISVSDARYDARYKANTALGSALMKLGKTAEAGVAFREAALDSNNPNPTVALLNLGICFMALNRPADAAVSYESALQFGMSPAEKNKLYANLGQAYVACGKMKEAVHAFEQALADKTYVLSDSAGVDYQRAVAILSTAVVSTAAASTAVASQAPATQIADQSAEENSRTAGQAPVDRDASTRGTASMDPVKPAEKTARKESVSASWDSEEEEPSGRVPSEQEYSEEYDEYQDEQDDYASYDDYEEECDGRSYGGQAYGNQYEDYADYNNYRGDARSARGGKNRNVPRGSGYPEQGYNREMAVNQYFGGPEGGQSRNLEIKNKRHLGLKIAIALLVVFILAFAAAIVLYVNGFGYPTQEAVTAELFANPTSAVSTVFSSDISRASALAMVTDVVQDSQVVIDGVNKTMSASTVFATATIAGGGSKITYKISMVRDSITWKISSVEIYHPSLQ